MLLHRMPRHFKFFFRVSQQILGSSCHTGEKKTEGFRIINLIVAFLVRQVTFPYCLLLSVQKKIILENII